MTPLLELLRALPGAWLWPPPPCESDRRFTALAVIQICGAGFVCAQLPRAIGEHYYVGVVAGAVYLVVVWRRIVTETSRERT